MRADLLKLAERHFKLMVDECTLVKTDNDRWDYYDRDGIHFIQYNFKRGHFHVFSINESSWTFFRYGFNLKGSENYHVLSKLLESTFNVVPTRYIITMLLIQYPHEYRNI